MAVKITTKSGAVRLLPTTVEVKDKIDESLADYVEAATYESHIQQAASTSKAGHIKISNEAAADLAAVASAGNATTAAAADHVHKLPTAEQVGAVPSDHATKKATATELGHVKLTEDLNTTDGDSVLAVAKVKAAIVAVEQKLNNTMTEVAGGIHFESSYYFAKTQATTNITAADNSPASLSAKLGLTHIMDVTLVDLSEGKVDVYTAQSNASSWGTPVSKKQEGTFPINGSQIGVSGFFIDLSQGHFPGYALFSEIGHRWDFYPDRVLSMDNTTLVQNSDGKYQITEYTPATKDADTADFDGSEAARGYFDWVQGFYRKIRGLHSKNLSLETVVAGKVAQASTAGVYTSNGTATTITALSALGDANSIAKRDADGALMISDVQKEEDGAAVCYKYLSDKLSEVNDDIDKALNGLKFEEVTLQEADWAVVEEAI